jgi:TPR repeat protein
MMAGMDRPALVLVTTVAAALLGAAPARAQFYDLEAAYRCLTRPDAGCAAAATDVPRETARAEDAKRPTLDEAIAHASRRAVAPADMRLLEERAAAREARAVEVLAWCRLNGVGGARDAVAAYWLYRDAAALGVANARRNQAVVYETRLTPDERQQVLLQENAR